MRRFIVLLLITGTVWAQTDFDKLAIEEKAIYHKLRKRNLRQIITCSAIIFILGPFFYIGMVESGLGGGPSFPLP